MDRSLHLLVFNLLDRLVGSDLILEIYHVILHCHDYLVETLLVVFQRFLCRSHHLLDQGR